MSTHDFDVVVIGAGVVGLATAAELAKAGRRVVVLERNEGIARGITARNSEVLHAGIYYEPGSLKARFCVEGNGDLYRQCETRGVPFRRTEKLIVASSDEEIPVLERLLARGQENGARELELIDAATTRSLEPAVRARAALLSPSTGIVDAHALALSFLAECEALGGVLLIGAEVVDVSPAPSGWRVEVVQVDGERTGVVCGGVVNAAGLDSDRVAELAGVDVDEAGYRIHYCKGDYFCLSPGFKVSLSRLIYPVPVEAGLGIHATIDLGGRVRFGPDTQYISAPQYTVAPEKARDFAVAIGNYLPEVEEQWLVPDFAGIRPRLAAKGEGFRDFVVREESDRGAPGWVNCIGIESPGLTAAPAIAGRVVSELASL